MPCKNHVLFGLQKPASPCLHGGGCIQRFVPACPLPFPKVCNPDELLHFLSNYLTELSLLDYNMLHFNPSVIAAAGVYLANVMLKRQPWNATLQHYSTYAPADIAQCVIALAAVHQAASTSQSLGSIREKYAHRKFHEVSKLPGTVVSMQMFM